MTAYRKKPVVIEAWQVTADDGATRAVPPAWLIAALVAGNATAIEGGGILIGTLEGEMRGNVGDWIIRGVKGELYPCKPEIFAATYEPEVTEPFPNPGICMRPTYYTRHPDDTYTVADPQP